MLSKTEREYLAGKYLPSKSHRRVLNHRIKKKMKEFFMLELPILQGSGITDFGNTVTEFSNMSKNTLNFPQKSKPMVRFGLTTFRLQGECSSQAELHWHEIK